VSPPFDAGLLDRLMEEAGLDAVLATSKHNVQYLLGGHRYFFFDYMDAIGVGRYLPVVLYVRGDVGASTYVGNVTEGWQLDNEPLWIPTVELSSWGSVDAIEAALRHLRMACPSGITVGVEQSFLPADSFTRLAQERDLRLGDAFGVLERLRARKSAAELAVVERASDAIVESMTAVFVAHGAGATKRELVAALRTEQVRRGLTYEYCLISMGADHNRGESDQAWQPGEVLCLDSGGNLGGYIGDLARMAVLGPPDAELVELLAEVEETQQAARRPIRAGAVGSEIYAAAGAALSGAMHRGTTSFVAHGMGLVSHEAPRLTATGPVPYPADDGPRPLEAGMVLSIETTLLHERRGFIKLEDTVAVTDDGYRAFGDAARSWTVAGA
jgi:Xaa-Pro aminopeptidase